MNQVYFARQNSLLKLLYVLITALTTAFIPINKFLILTIIQLLYFMLNYKIIFRWLTIMLRLLPFFTSLLAISIIFATPFNLQLILAARISFILLLSVFLLISGNIDSFISDTSTWSKYRLLNDLRLFLISTMYFIPIFVQLFNEKKRNSRINFTILPEIIQDSFSKIREVEEKAVARLDNSKRKFDLTANLSLILLIVINTILFFYRGEF